MRLKIKERMLIASLRDSNVYKVMIDYSGGGDDGCIDYTEAFDSEDKSIDTDQIKKTLNELDEFFYRLLSNNIEYDWINNSGGNGSATFYVTTLEVEIDHYQNIQENYEYKFEIDGPSVIA
mgnify:CR=1 FL=1